MPSICKAAARRNVMATTAGERAKKKGPPSRVKEPLMIGISCRRSLSPVAHDDRLKKSSPARKTLDDPGTSPTAPEGHSEI